MQGIPRTLWLLFAVAILTASREHTLVMCASHRVPPPPEAGHLRAAVTKPQWVMAED